MNAPQKLTLPQAARRLGYTWHRTWSRVLTGDLKAEQIGGRWQVDARDVESFAQRLAAGPTQRAGR